MAHSSYAQNSNTMRFNTDTPPASNEIVSATDSGLIIPETEIIEQFPKMNFGLDNKYFTNITTLQYQNSLLEILTERQLKTKEIADSFRTIGLPFNQPPPPRNVCAELPRNALCSSFYKDLYQTKIAPRREAADDNDSTPPVQVKETKKKKETAKKNIVKPVPYRWADISCVAGSCRAVLVGSGDEAQTGRSTVTVGNVMKDGWQVSEIGFNKVKMIKDSRVETLNPLPSSGAPSPYLPVSVKNTNVSSDTTNDLSSEFNPEDFETEINVEELLSELEQDPSLGLDDEIQIIE